MASYIGFCILQRIHAVRAATRGSTMWCRGAIHSACLGSRGIPQGAMNCAPTPPFFGNVLATRGNTFQLRDIKEQRYLNGCSERRTVIKLTTVLLLLWLLQA